MQKYLSKEVVCPFYHKEDSTKILCEGFCKSCCIQITFTSKLTLAMHKDRHCNDIKGYTKCPLYPIIIKQYN
jgi:hypothetical protein